MPPESGRRRSCNRTTNTSPQPPRTAYDTGRARSCASVAAKESDASSRPPTPKHRSAACCAQEPAHSATQQPQACRSPAKLVAKKSSRGRLVATIEQRNHLRLSCHTPESDMQQAHVCTASPWQRRQPRPPAAQQHNAAAQHQALHTMQASAGNGAANALLVHPAPSRCC